MRVWFLNVKWCEYVRIVYEWHENKAKQMRLHGHKRNHDKRSDISLCFFSEPIDAEKLDQNTDDI